MRFDDSQKKFVESDAQNIRLLAPAGSGKTLTLLYRCKELLDRNPQQRILAFSFTRVARSELSRRLARLPELMKYAERIKISTLNSYGMGILREQAIAPQLIDRKVELLGEFRRLLREGMKHSSFLQKCVQDRNWVNRNAVAVMKLIDTFKALGFDHKAIGSREEFKAYAEKLTHDGIGEKLEATVRDLQRLGFVSEETARWEDQLDEVFRKFFGFYNFASRRMGAEGVYTLEDQKYWGWRLTKGAERVTGAARYQHIMVDEFQDINPIDLMFIDALRKRHGASLTLVGDDDQSIFEWRGATPWYILNPDGAFGIEEEESRFETYKLTTNYRSPKNIVALSQRLIGHNRNRVAKEMTAFREENASIRIMHESDFDSIAEEIERDFHKPGGGKVAVVSRKRSHLLPYQIIFASRGIDFFAAEDLNVFMGDVFADLREVTDLKRLQQKGELGGSYMLARAFANLVRRIRPYPLSKKHENAFVDYMGRGTFQDIQGALEHLRQMPAGELSRSVGVQKACEVLRLFWETQTVKGMLNCLAVHFDGMQQNFRRVDDDIFFSDPPFVELTAFAARYGTDFGRFGVDLERATATLSCIAYEEDERSSKEGKASADGLAARLDTRLHLMTALRTKGKEFGSVYILHANKDVWPHKKAVSEEQLEAERRLFYVAVTRAQEKLTFVVDNHVGDSPSPYLAEMGLEMPNAQAAEQV